VESPRVVEGLDVVEDRRPGLDPGGPRVVMDQLVLQSAEEALDHRVVVTPALPTHTGHDTVSREERLVGRSGVLAPLRKEKKVSGTFFSSDWMKEEHHV